MFVFVCENQRWHKNGQPAARPETPCAGITRPATVKGNEDIMLS